MTKLSHSGGPMEDSTYVLLVRRETQSLQKKCINLSPVTLRV